MTIRRPSPGAHLAQGSSAIDTATGAPPRVHLGEAHRAGAPSAEPASLYENRLRHHRSPSVAAPAPAPHAQTAQAVLPAPVPTRRVAKTENELCGATRERLRPARRGQRKCACRRRPRAPTATGGGPRGAATPACRPCARPSVACWRSLQQDGVNAPGRDTAASAGKLMCVWGGGARSAASAGRKRRNADRYEVRATVNVFVPCGAPY